MNNLYLIFGNACTFVGGIGTAIFLILCIVVAGTKINLPGGEKKFVEMPTIMVGENLAILDTIILMKTNFTLVLFGMMVLQDLCG